MNRLDKTVSVVIASVVLLSACSNSSKTDETVVPSDEETVIETTAEATPTPEPTNTPTPTPTVYSIDGDYIVFGRYEQDGNLDNGPEPIEWEIVSEEDGRMLLVSRYILDYQQYNIEQTDVTWETCSLRSWLNDDFINTAFSNAERDQILETTITNSDHPLSGTEGGNDTVDQIFCLSVDEILANYTINNWNEDNPNDHYGFCQDLITEVTPYAVDRGALEVEITADAYYSENMQSLGLTEDIIGIHSGYWWLRSPGSDGNTYACTVNVVGCTGWRSGWYVFGQDVAVRPALYLSTQ